MWRLSQGEIGDENRPAVGGNFWLRRDGIRPPQYNRNDRQQSAVDAVACQGWLPRQTGSPRFYLDSIHCTNLFLPQAPID